ncbi:MAG: hypothetical protein F6K26_41070 [Moorea sp. SIO2I5]|nr:hypothetical protein [Moorena sp. SIO2I5]
MLVPTLLHRLSRTRCYSYLPVKLKKWANKKITIQQWKDKGCPAPPPHIVKQSIIQSLRRATGIKTFVETGTYKGHMIAAVADDFDAIYSIELGEDLYLAAKQRFQSFSNINLILGDSAVQLQYVVETLDSPAIFWLDGHYSEGETARGEKETPIIQELEAIFTSPQDHVIVIDDARCFNGKNGYPTIQQLKKIIYKKRPNWNFEHIADQLIINNYKSINLLKC